MINNFYLKDIENQITFLISCGANKEKIWNACKLNDISLEEASISTLKNGSTFVFNNDSFKFNVSDSKIVYNQSMTEDERSDLVDYLNTFNRTSKKEVCISIYPNVLIDKPVLNGYAGCVYSPTQNRIYFVPLSQADKEYWHYIDCNNGIVQKYLNPFYNQPGEIYITAYIGGVYSPTQNRIYFVPYGQSDKQYWHYIECNNGIAQKYINPFTLGTDKCYELAYNGGIYSPTQNRIYFAPYNQANQYYWHYIDCNDGTVHSYSNIATNRPVSLGYKGGVYSPTQNRIYFVPYAQSDKEYWHYIDCNDGTVQKYLNPFYVNTPLTRYAYNGGVYSPTQNRIYFVPYDQTIQEYWHYIDCDNGSVKSYINPFYNGVSLQKDAYICGVYSPTQNRIYFVPHAQSDKDYWHYIDCDDGTVHSYSNISTNIPVSNAYNGGVYSPTQNRIYFTPNRQCTVNYFHCIDELSKFPVDRGLMASECYNKF